MLNEDKRQTIHTLFNTGTPRKEIARLLKADIKTVRKILAGNVQRLLKPRSDKKDLDVELVSKVYLDCGGFMHRVHEILTEEHKINIGYSTLTQFIRAKGIGKTPETRHHRIEDVPGEEMQHDTSPYSKIKIGNKTVDIVCSVLYFRYSKMRYVRFYLNFNRFIMKCFLHEALTFFGYTARTCVIDNTNLAVLRGTGRDAVFNPEMKEFAKSYGFQWLAHEQGHANRKAGEERSFRTINSSFFPGRNFSDMKSLNAQAFNWATLKYARRPQSKTKLIPVELFEIEKPCLIKLPEYIMAPYREHNRLLDQYGFIALNANYYWVPKESARNVFVIEYTDSIKIFPKDKSNKALPSMQYPLPECDIRNQAFKPKGVNTNPYQPNNLKKTYHEEEQYIRNLGNICCDYLDFIKSGKCNIFCKPKFIRELYLLQKKMALSLFIAVIERAIKYHVATIDGLKRISANFMKRDIYELPENLQDNDYQQRDTYKEGRFSNENEIQSLFNKGRQGEDSSDNG